MATTKNKLGSNDFDIDSFLNDNANLGSSKINTHIDKRSGAKSFAIGAISGAKDTLRSGSFWGRMLKKALPDSYLSSLDNIGKLKSTLSSAFDEAVRDVKPGLQQLSRQVDKLVPAEQKRLKAFTGKLNKITGGDLLNYQGDISQEQARQSTIDSALSQIFALQAEENARERARDGATRLIKEQTDLTRFNISSTLLGTISSSVSRLAAFNEKINIAYQKKSLELQYRSVFLQTDLLNTNKTLLELLRSQNNELIRLNSMPESEKIKNSAAYQKGIKGSFGTHMFGNNAFFDSLKNRIDRKKRDIVEKIKSGIEKGLMGVDMIRTGNEMSEMSESMGENNGSFIASLLGGYGLEAAVGSLVKKYKNKLIPENSKADNYAGRASAALNDIPSLARNLKDHRYLREDITKNGTVSEKIKELLRNSLDIFSPEKPDMMLKSSKIGLGDLGAPATFDNRAHKSITTIIPGYLARIYRELQITRTGNKNIELTEFNYSKDRFSTSKKITKDIDTDIKKSLKTGSLSYGKANAITALLGGESLSPEAKEALGRRIEDIGFDQSLAMSHSSFLDNNFLKTLDPSVAKEIKQHISSRYNRDEDTFGRRENSIGQALAKYRSYIPDIRSKLDMYNLAGHGSNLERLGYVGRDTYGYRDILLHKYRAEATADTIDVKKEIEDLINGGHRDILEELKIITPNKTDPDKYTINASNYFKAKRDGSLNERIRTSDVHAKGNIRQTQGRKILEGIRKIKSNLKWNYKDKNKGANEHVGPMAQDVNKHLGDEYAPGGKSIDVVSLNGASMAAIKELANEQDKMKSSLGKDNSVKEILLAIEENTRKMSGSGIRLGALSKDEIMALVNSGMLKASDLIQSGKLKVSDLINDLKESGILEKGKTTFKDILKYAGDKIGSGVYSFKRFLRKGRIAYNRKISPFIKNTAYPFAKEKVNGAYNFGKEITASGIAGLHNLINPVVDVYVKGDLSQPVLYADFILKGMYLDRETGKIIRSLNDIKGPVLDSEGNTVLTLQEMIKGLVDFQGLPIKNTSAILRKKAEKLLRKASDFIEHKIPNGIRNLRDIGKGGIDFLKNTVNAPRDIYVVGGTTPVLYKSVMEAGGYIDEKSGKVIRTIDDIKGQVLDDKENIVLTYADIAKGLVDVYGKPIRTLTQLAKDFAMSSLGFIKDKALGIFNKAKDFINNRKSSSGSGFNFGFSGGSSLKVLIEIRDILKMGFGIEDIHESYSSEENSDRKATGESNINTPKTKGFFYSMKEKARSLKNKLKGRMSNVSLQEKEYADQLAKNEANTAHADNKPRYMNGKGLFSGLMSKVKGFKGFLGKAFDMLADIPGVGKIGKLLGKIPLLGNLFKGASAAGEVAEGAEVAGAAAEGGGIMSAIGGLATGALSLAGSAAATVGGAALSAVLAVGGAALSGIAAVLTSPVLLVPAVIAGLGYAGYKTYKYFTRNNTDSLGKFRMAQYGFLEEQKKYYHYALSLEEFLIKNAVGYKLGKAYLIQQKMDVKKIFDIFGIDIKNTDQVHAFEKWFNGRFKPVFLNSVSALFAVNKNLRLTDTDKLSKDEITKMFPMVENIPGAYSVFSSPLISQGLSKLTADSKYVKSIYDKEFGKYKSFLEHKAKSENKSKNTTIKKAVATAAATTAATAKDKSALDKVGGFFKNAYGKAKEYAGKTAHWVAGKAAGAYSWASKAAHKAYTISGTALKTAYKAVGSGLTTAGKAAMTAVKYVGKNISAMKDMISKIAISAGINPAIMLVIAAIESSFNPSAMAATSTASGLYQFTIGTWQNMVHMYGSQFGITEDTPRTDPKANAIMGAMFLKQNIEILKQVKPNPTPTDVYLAHFLGPAGALAILKADPSEKAADILPAAARANQSLFYKNGNALTVAQFYDGINTLVNKRATQFGLNISGPELASGDKKPAAPINRPSLDNVAKTNETPQTPNSKPLVSNNDPMALNRTTGSYSQNIPTAKETTRQNTAVPTPAKFITKASPAEVGQGFHMQKVHEGLSDVSGILNQSLLVQKQMLDSINKIASNSSGAKTQTSGNAEAPGKQATQVPKPAVSLNRNS